SVLWPPSYVSVLLSYQQRRPQAPHPFPTRRSSDLRRRGTPSRAESSTASSPGERRAQAGPVSSKRRSPRLSRKASPRSPSPWARSEEHTSELQSRFDLVCRLLLEKKKKNATTSTRE